MESLPTAASVTRNPSPQQLRDWVLDTMPRVQVTEHGNVGYTAMVTARLGPSTFFVSDTPTGKPTMARADHERWVRKQDAFIADQHMLLVEGYIGPDPDFRTPVRLYIERKNANIPAMQQQLYFPPDEHFDDAFADDGFTVIYTPGLLAPGMPDHRLITVDLDHYVTRVFGSDYFGESKMGGLRMWNHLVHQRGGLAMHSGAKVFPAEETPDGEEQLALIIGLSGTGKTTTTFREVKGSLPVQDDFIGLFPDGVVHATENGCFAKTYGLDPDDEPTIHGGAIRPDAWLENTSIDPEGGRIDFFDDRYTRNGRCTFGLAGIRHRDPHDLPRARYLFILNRNESIMPAVARLRPEQAAHYFMLGETKGTSAGGAAEAGKNLRVPGTNPFWFEDDASQANRLLALLEQHPLEAYVLNTGRVGGPDSDERSKKVTIEHSAALQAGIVDRTIEWVTDPDFGYEVAATVPGIEDDELLRPRRLYERQGRLDEYEGVVADLARERFEYLEGFPALDERVRTG